MALKFTKMHGLGNDYVYINCFEETVENPSELAVRVSDRHMGIGSDGLVLIHPSSQADARMQMFNADGSEAQMCGNALRCVSKFIYEHQREQVQSGGEPFSVPGHGTFETSLSIETGRGILTVGLETNSDDHVLRVCVNMGQPILKAADIPVSLNMDSVIDVPIDVLVGEQMQMTCVSMGNPHAVFFCEHIWNIDLDRIGPLVENHELFPERTNVHFVKADAPDEFTMRTWERGSGITMACGTGACACCVAGVLTGRCGREVTAHLPGGALSLYWCEQDNCVYMTGPAAEVFTGVWHE